MICRDDLRLLLFIQFLDFTMLFYHEQLMTWKSASFLVCWYAIFSLDVGEGVGLRGCSGSSNFLAFKVDKLLEVDDTIYESRNVNKVPRAIRC